MLQTWLLHEKYLSESKGVTFLLNFYDHSPISIDNRRITWNACNLMYKPWNGPTPSPSFFKSRPNILDAWPARRSESHLLLVVFFYWQEMTICISPSDL